MAFQIKYKSHAKIYQSLNPSIQFSRQIIPHQAAVIDKREHKRDDRGRTQLSNQGSPVDSEPVESKMDPPQDRHDITPKESSDDMVSPRFRASPTKGRQVPPTMIGGKEPRSMRLTNALFPITRTLHGKKSMGTAVIAFCYSSLTV